MKFLSRMSCLAMVLAFSSIISAGYANAADEQVSEKPVSMDEVQRLISELPTAKDATSGTVPVDVGDGIYDIYARQIAYRESVKAFRKSLDDRRENYQSSYIDKKKNYQNLIDKIYKAEIAAYKKNLGKETMAENKNIGEVVAEVADVDGEVLDAPQVSETDNVDGGESSTEGDGGLKEADVPPKEGEEGKVKKKVVTSDDAPDFNPADVSEGGMDEDSSDIELDDLDEADDGSLEELSEDDVVDENPFVE
ncbi:MAG: hypothetical protein ACRBDI_05105 [Alphaproteobacteria bacterium]